MIETSSDMGTMLEALKSCPGDSTAWMAFADSLEEIGMTAEAEVVRLRTLLQEPECADRMAREDRLRHLLYVDKIDPPVVEHVNSIGMRFVLIPPGTFWMGSPEDEENRHTDEGPRHKVTLTKPFWMGMHQVTRQQWESIMGNDPSGFQDGSKDCPVEQVRWREAYEFCRRLSELPEERAARSVYRLPTEAEWEYACRGGTTTVFHYGNSLSSKQANFDGNYPYGGAEKGPYLKRTTPVGSYLPNSWKLYDMHGNVWEWCADGYDSTWYSKSPEVDPVCANPYPNGVPWGNRAKKEEVKAETADSFQQGDPGRWLDQLRPVLPGGLPQRLRGGLPRQHPRLPDTEGGESVEEPFQSGNPGRQLVLLRPELPVGGPLRERADVPVQLPGLTDSQGGELVEEPFQPGDPGRQLERLRPGMPVGVPPQVRDEEPGLQSGLPNSEGGEPVAGEPFQPGESGRRLDQLRQDLPGGEPQQERADVPVLLPGLPSNEGGELVTGESFPNDPRRRLGNLRSLLSVEEQSRLRNDESEKLPWATDTQGGEVLIDDTFQPNIPGRKLVLRLSDLPVGGPHSRAANTPVQPTGLQGSEGGESVTDDPFRSSCSRRELELQLDVLPHGVPVLVSAVSTDEQPRVENSEGGEPVLEEVSARVLRGGSWFSYGRFCRSAFRSRLEPGNRFRYSGFRIVIQKG